MASLSPSLCRGEARCEERAGQRRRKLSGEVGQDREESDRAAGRASQSGRSPAQPAWWKKTDSFNVLCPEMI